MSFLFEEEEEVLVVLVVILVLMSLSAGAERSYYLQFDDLARLTLTGCIGD